MEPVDRSAQVLSDGRPVTDDHCEINSATGQQKDYVVLTAEERAKGFVRPVRQTYTHVGPAGPKNLRDLTDAEKERYAAYNYAKYEAYPMRNSSVAGRFWTQEQLDAVRRGGCGTDTTMDLAITQTYARDPGFYSSTFCCRCRVHLPLNEFVWKGTDLQVGS